MISARASISFALKKTRASGRNVGKVFNPVVKLVLENQPFLMPEPAEKPLQGLQKLFIGTFYPFKVVNFWWPFSNYGDLH